MGRTGLRHRELLLDLWVVLWGLALSAPLFFAVGYPLSRDMVFTPRQPLRPEALGLGSSAPRAAPLDVVVALLERVVDGAVLARLAVLGALVVGGLVAHRMTKALPWWGRALAGALAVWNPYVVERLALGQWALLLGYAGVWGLVAGVMEVSRGGSWWRLGPWLALAALTPTGALLGALVVLARLVSRRPPGWHVGVGLVVAAQLPWLLPALLGSAAATSDGRGVAVFMARGEGGLPAAVALLGGGGIWDGTSVPRSREGWGAAVAAVVCAVALGHAASRRRGGMSRDVREHLAPLHRRWLWALGISAYGLAVLPTIGPAAAVLRQLGGVVPGLGLLRDSQKWLAPFVVLTVLAVAHGATELVITVGPKVRELAPALATMTLLLPFLLLPDGAATSWPTVRPTVYPAGFDLVSKVVDGQPGIMVVVPWQPYQAFRWAGTKSVFDPASRWFDVDVVTSDALRVGPTQLAGEDPRSRVIGEILTRSSSTDVGPRLARAGVRWVLEYSAPGVTVAGVAGLPAAVRTPELTLRSVASTSSVVSGPAPWRTWLVALADTVVAVLLLGGATISAGWSANSRPRRGGAEAPEDSATLP